MFCFFCGKQIQDGSAFCPACGKSLKDVNPQPQGFVPPQQQNFGQQPFVQQPQQNFAQQTPPQPQRFQQTIDPMMQQSPVQPQQNFAQQTPQQQNFAQQTPQQPQRFQQTIDPMMQQSPVQPQQNFVQQTPPQQNFAQQTPPQQNFAQQTPPQPQRFQQAIDPMMQQPPIQPQQNFVQQTPQQQNFTQKTPQQQNFAQQTPPQPQSFQQTMDPMMQQPPVQPQQNFEQQIPPQPQYQQQVQPVYDAKEVTAPAKPKKKFNKKGLFIGLGAAAGVVAVTGGILMFTARPFLLRTFMGNENYAKSVQANYLKSIMSGTVSLSDIMKGYKGLYGSVAEIAKTLSSTSSRYSELSQQYGYSQISIASAMYAYMTILEQAAGKEITVTAGLKAEIGSDLKKILQDKANMTEETWTQITDLVDNINSFEAKIAQSAGDDGYGMCVSLNSEGSQLASAVLRLSKNGDLRIGFPEITEKVFTAQLPSYSEMGFTAMEKPDEKNAEEEQKKLEAFVKKVAEAYCSGYKDADIKFTDEDVTFGEKAQKCTVVSVTMTNKSMATSMRAVADVCESDSYFDELLEFYRTYNSYYSVSELKTNLLGEIRRSADSLEKSGQFEFVIQNFVNGMNTPLGARVVFAQNGTEYARIESVDNGSFAGLDLIVNNGKMLSVKGTHDKKSGDFDILFDPYAASTYSQRDSKLAMNLSYSDVEKFKAFDKDMLGGTVKFRLKDSSMFTGMDSELYDVIKSIELNVSLKGENDGYAYSVGVSAGNYGSYSVNMAAAPGADIPAVNGGKNIDINNISSDDSQELINEFLEYFKKKAETNKFAKFINDSLLSTMTGYVTASKVTSADSTASTLKDSFNVFITQKDTRDASIKRTSAAEQFILTTGGNGSKYKFDFYGSTTADAILSKNAKADDSGAAWLADFAKQIENDYNFDEITALFVVKNGMCIGVAYYAGTQMPEYFPTAPDFEYGDFYWNSDKAGVTADGTVIGTNPKLYTAYYYDEDRYLQQTPSDTGNDDPYGTDPDNGTWNTSGGSSDEGKVVNIYCWNEEFKGFFEKYYAGTAPLSDGTYFDKAPGIPDGITINWVIKPSDDGYYQYNLDAALINNQYASADDKVDIFLGESDYLEKYVASDYTLDLAELGIKYDGSEYTYTTLLGYDFSSSDDGKYKAAAYQCCPSALIYRRSIAKELFGTDDPEVVQSCLDTWEKYESTAALAKSKGYYMQASYAENYRAMTAGLSEPWVVGGQLTIPGEIEQWTDMIKNFADNGYILDSMPGIWDEDKMEQMYADGRSLCFFGPAWYYEYCMWTAQDPDKGCYGDWAICKGPEAHFWGGTWLMAASGTDNPTMVADIINAFTDNTDILSALVENEAQFTNNIYVNRQYCATKYDCNDFLGGEADLSVMSDIAENIEVDYVTIYDQKLNEWYTDCMKDYFAGYYSKEEALQNFYNKVKEIYPELETP